MGASGALMIAIVICLVKSVRTVIKFFCWNSETKTVAKIVKLKDTIFKYSDEKNEKISSVKYLYTIEYEINGTKRQIGYTEERAKNNPSKFKIGDDMEIYVNEKTQQIQNVANLKLELICWPVGFFVSCLGLWLMIVFSALTFYG